MPELDPVSRSVIGRTGLPIWAGRVYDEFLPQLQGDKAFPIWREMSEQDPVIGGIILAIELLTRRTPFPVLPKELADDATDEDLQKAQDVADFVDECLNDMHPSWGETIPEVLSMISFGWSYHEVVYKLREGQVTDPTTGLPDPTQSSAYNDGLIGWKAWPIRAQETRWAWDLDRDGNVKGFWQMAPPDYETLFIPIAKSLHFRVKARKGNPEGTSMLRSAYRPWYYKKQIEKIEAIGIERDLAGLPVAWIPPEYMSSDATATQAELFETVKKIVTSIKRDDQEGLIMPLEYDENGKQRFDLKLLATGGARQFDTDKIITRYDQRMAMAFLADFMLLGHEAVGSFALASSKTEMFARAVGAILDVICSVINTAAIPMLLSLNGIDPAFTPTLAHGDIAVPDLNDLGTFIQRLALAGFEMFPNKHLENYLLEAAGLPVPSDLDDEEEDVIPGLDEALEYLSNGQTGTPPALGDGTVPPGQPPQLGPGQTAPPGRGAPQQPGQPGRPRQAQPGQPVAQQPGRDQNKRLGRTTQSAAARQIRQPGAVQRTAASEGGGGGESTEEFTLRNIAPYPPSRLPKVVRPKRDQKAQMIRTMLLNGHPPSTVAKHLGIRPQHVHTVRQRMLRGLQTGTIIEQGMGPTVQQDIIDTIR